MAPRPTHHRARAKSVIFLYMDGGPSQMDTFDPKPRLAREHGQPPRFRVEATQFNNNGTVLQSPWRFHQYGQSGIPVSDLFPHVAEPVADLRPSATSAAAQRNRLELIRRLDQRTLERTGPSDPLEAAIANYELACRMQTAVPELMDLTGESRATRRLYGLDDRVTEIFGQRCLVARRLVERGV